MKQTTILLIAAGAIVLVAPAFQLLGADQTIFSDDFEAASVGSPPNAPQIGTYVSADALVVTGATNAAPGAHAGTNYLFLNRVVGDPASRHARTLFTTNAAAARNERVHTEAWILWESGFGSIVQLGYDTVGDNFGTIFSLWSDQTIRVYSGNNDGSTPGVSHVVTGLSLTPGVWQKYALDWTVGSTQMVVTLDGSSTVAKVEGQTVAKGLWLDIGSSNGRGYVDDVSTRLETNGLRVLFGDNFYNSSVGSPPSAPQVGSYASAAALVANDATPGYHGGPNYLTLDRPSGGWTARPRFTSNATAANGDDIHAEAWIRRESGAVQWGLDTVDDPYATIVTINANGTVTVYTGNGNTGGGSFVDSGLTNAPSVWTKYEIDYVVGSNRMTLSVNGQSVSMAVLPETTVKGLWFDAGTSAVLGYVEDVLAWTKSQPPPPPPPTLAIRQFGGPPDAPQTGSYAPVPSPASVTRQLVPGPHGGKKYLELDRLTYNQV